MRSIIWQNRRNGKYLTYLERNTHTGIHRVFGETDNIELAARIAHLPSNVKERYDYEQVEVIVTITPVDTLKIDKLKVTDN